MLRWSLLKVGRGLNVIPFANEQHLRLCPWFRGETESSEFFVPSADAINATKLPFKKQNFKLKLTAEKSCDRLSICYGNCPFGCWWNLLEGFLVWNSYLGKFPNNKWL